MLLFIFQPDELYFEEGDILYISDTVRKTSDAATVFLPHKSSCPVQFESESSFFLLHSFHIFFF